jgi:hypothetical protein
MASSPKNDSTRTRRTLGGGTKTVTKSKNIDAAGTKTKTRTVTRETPTKKGVITTDEGRLILGKGMVTSKKEVTKKRFPDRSTSKSKKETVYRGGENKNLTTVKEKTSKGGLLNKAKGLVKGSDKYAYTSGNNFVSSAKDVNYGYAKKLQKNIKKGRTN